MQKAVHASLIRASACALAVSVAFSLAPLAAPLSAQAGPDERPAALSPPMDISVVEADDFDGTISTPEGAKRISIRVKVANALSAKAIDGGFQGEIVIDMGELMLINAVSPDLAREGYGSINGEPPLWPFASVTKQKLAARLTDELDAYDVSLDTRISEFVPGIGGKGVPVPTIRQLLQHRSGLRNPDDTPIGPNGWPEFYNKPAEYGLEWCLNGRAAPPAKGWSYNNCDYIVLGAAFDELSFESVEYMLGAGALASDDQSNSPTGQTFINDDNASDFFRMGAPEQDVIPAYGASAALGGTLIDIVFSNWSLMQGYENALEKGKAKAAFWKGDPNLGYMALGHWVFDVEHPSCDAPIKVSQRKGEIGKFRLENIMLPELKRSMVFATFEPGFEFGEIWAKQGFLYDAVGQLACGDKS
ncbi:MAG: serine hydrolase [Pseudomonadota bacterium]